MHAPITMSRNCATANLGALIVTFHFPPIQGSSGIHRSLSLVRHLPEHGINCTVLTARPMAYEHVAAENMEMIPRDTRVLRVLAMDAVRHLGWKGRHIQAFTRPDRWSTWLLFAVFAGWRELRQSPSIILSTYPIATAHLIGWALHRLTGLPWVADFRDPMAQDDYPHDPATWRWYRRIEGLAVRHASRLVFTAPSACDYYLHHHHGLSPDRTVVIENGFEEVLFDDELPPGTRSTRQPLVFLHSGLLYPIERDPSAFFMALAELKQQRILVPGEVRFDFRAAGNEREYKIRIKDLGLQGLVQFTAPISYRDAIREMQQADCLMIFQASDCNFQIPAKVYEYLRTGRPILGFCDTEGDTAVLLQSAGINTVASLKDRGAIAGILAEMLNRLRDGTAPLPRKELVAKMSRSHRAADYAAVLRAVCREYDAKITC